MENIKKFITHFFHPLEISHRVLCPYTHQQNGSAECKHRHIVETGLVLLAHVDVPIKFWDDTFLTSTYLINRLPTRIIDKKKCSLLRAFFHTPPNYSVFWCACWPHLRPYNKQKLSFRSKECVFLGYISLHKGYMFFDIDSGRVYISRDFIFDENVFRFKRPHPVLPQPYNRRTMPLIRAPCIWVTTILIWKMIIEILVTPSASEFSPQSFASLPRKSASIVPLMIGPRMLWADAILASPGPHLDSLGSNPRERSPVWCL